MSTTKQRLIASFDPNGISQGDNLYGLPFDEETAEVIVIPVPWEVTVSYSAGTADGPKAILEASKQVDLYQKDIKDAWQLGVYMREEQDSWRKMSDQLRNMAEKYIGMLEDGLTEEEEPEMSIIKKEINKASFMLKEELKAICLEVLQDGKTPVVLGGDHSTPLGLIEALAEHYGDFGILQIDAHADLREAYEGFEYSHASITYNALKRKEVSSVVQVGIRDFCDEEAYYMSKHADRIVVFFDDDIREKLLTGSTFDAICNEIVDALPQHIYISFDIDGLDPQLCPGTGTPVPGGLSFAEANHLLKKVAASGKKIIAFDLNEVAPADNEWNGNVGARLLYRMINLMGVSQGKLHWR